MQLFYVYVLRSLKDGLFYTGYTSDVKKRLSEHNSGSVKSTNYRRPFELIYFMHFIENHILKQLMARGI